MGLLGGAVVKNPPVGAGDVRDTGLIPGSGSSPAVGTGNPLQYSCLESSMDRAAWWATGYNCHKQSDRTGHAQTHTHIIEGRCSIIVLCKKKATFFKLGCEFNNSNWNTRLLRVWREKGSKVQVKMYKKSKNLQKNKEGPASPSNTVINAIILH